MTILDRILNTKREEVEAAWRMRSLDEVKRLAELAPPPRDFVSALMRKTGEPIRVIAEIKKASPSAGVIVENFDPAAIARAYAENGAAAISVLTDRTYFQGALEHIELVKRNAAIPVLRKDFIVDEYQLYEARAAGADAVLLIVEAIGVERAKEWLPIARKLGMGVIVEVHSSENMRATLSVLGTPTGTNYFLGINNRDLAEQKTSTNNALTLSSMIGDGEAAWIAESGIKSREDVQSAERAGACAVLVGESLLRAKDVGEKLRELM